VLYAIIYQENAKIYKKEISLSQKETIEDIFDKYPHIISIKRKGIKKSSLFKRKRKDEIYLLFSQLSMMVDSGLTLVEAIEIINSKNTNPIIGEILQRLKEAIVKSLPIDKLLLPYEKYLGKTPIVFLQLGFNNGNINIVLKALVEVLKQDNTVKNQLKQSLRYPILLLVSLIIAIGMIFVYVLPNFEFIFNVQKNIPFATKILLDIQYSISHYYIRISATILILTVGTILTIRKYPLWWDKIKLRNIPLFSKILQYYYFYKLFLAMSIIVQSKVQFQIAVLNSKQIIDNRYIQKTIEQILQEIKNGSTIAQSFSQYSLFDEVIIKLLVSAENSSNYANVLEHIAQYYKKKFQSSIQNFEAILEPFIVMMISLIVLWLILAIMVPIWDMASFSL
jgi:type II secretory pathway component PulF